MLKRTIVFGIACLLAIHGWAQEKPGQSAKELADKLSNPVAAMISVPLQNNIDYGIGVQSGSKYTLNVQPVVPISLGPKWNLITRYIFPIIDQRNITSSDSRQFGLSDATISAWLSPKGSKNGLIWGAGPVFLVPSGSDVSSHKWGIGPTALILDQKPEITFGVLINQIWSIAGDQQAEDVNQMFVQPFIAHNWKSGAGISLNSEITCNWHDQSTTAFLNLLGTAITKFGSQIVQFGVGPRIPLAAPNGRSTDFGLRAVVTFIFPQ
jgi:hypothetical protein